MRSTLSDLQYSVERLLGMDDTAMNDADNVQYEMTH